MDEKNTKQDNQDSHHCQQKGKDPETKTPPDPNQERTGFMVIGNIQLCGTHVGIIKDSYRHICFNVYQQFNYPMLRC